MICQLHIYDQEGNCRDCAVLAVSIWTGRFGNEELAVCEQHEALIKEMGMENFQPIPS